ncbi:hypothetical protein [Salinibacter ruber]|uniref:hypothetical protein n=1 Tax=Salinibacter ruber TaxID=146919 RepID=UPI002073F13D|nr:hypothetical protein [Salinibacter ruber]
MKKLLFRVLIFSGSIAVIFSLYALLFIGGGNDNFYRRFTTPPSKSLIVGSSRCAQGIVPEEIDESGLRYDGEMFNYCFTNGHSPYGPYYLRSIRKKTGDVNDGLFLVEVNPWNISVRGNADSDEPDTFRESSRFISDMRIVNYLNPNLEYIIKHYEGPYYKDFYGILIGKKDKTKLKENGWLRVEVSIDSSTVAGRKADKFSAYRKLSKEWAYSRLRMDYLEELLRFFEKRGEAYVVRMPVSEGMYGIERCYMPNFDERVEKIAQSTGAEYISFFEKSGVYTTTDGNHLWREDARRFSNDLAKSIK